ncbi:hypothetical protein EON81_10045 [bacterium]|nr:MAG: hypothetical protein EON81_10045 [bacterium]
MILLWTLFCVSLAPAQTVVGWGRDDSGQSVPPTGLTGVAQVAAGDFHALALKTDGTVVAWGNNEAGQCDVPPGLSGVIQVAAGGYRSLALKSDGKVVAWGLEDEVGPPAGLSNVVRVSIGQAHSLALKSDGTVVAWGNNDNGQGNVPAGLSGVVGISAGGYHSLALKSDGTVAAWGDDSAGEIDVPLGLSGVVQVAAGAYHSLALRSDGSVVAWGWNENGQCTVPAGLSGVAQLAGGYAHSLARRSDGSILSWGWNGTGQGDVPVGLLRTAQVEAGMNASLATVPLELSLDRSAVYSGEVVTGIVNILQPAPAGGATVSLGSSDPAVHVPSTVAVAPGASTVTFPVTTDLTFRDIAECRIAADYEGARLVAKLKVTGQIATLKSSHASIVGGSTTNPTLTVTLKWPALSAITLPLRSDGALGLPATVTIPAGATNAKVGFAPARVSADALRTIRASYGGEDVSAVTVKLLMLRATVSFGEPVLDGGQGTLGFVYLNAPVRESIAIPISSGDPAVRSLSASVQIGPGARQAHFSIATDPVSTAKNVRVTATVNGNPFYATLKVNAFPAINAVTLPAYLYGQGKGIGTVRLKSTARAGGTVVSLVSSDPSITVPATVTVPEGQYSATFEVRSADVAADVAATVTATSGPSSATAGIVVRPLGVASLVLSASAVTGGTEVTGTVTLNAVVQFDTVIVLSSADPALSSVPAMVTIPAGSRTGIFTIATGHPATAKSIRITASKHATSLYRTLKVNP